MTLDLECILAKVEAHSVKSQEWQTYYTVIPVNIGNIKICVAGDMSQVRWYMCAMGDGRATHPSCNSSWDSSMNVANLTMVANAGLMKFIMLPVLTIVNASHLLTFARTTKQVHRWKGTTGLGPGGPVTVFMHIAYQNVQSVASPSFTSHSTII